MPKPWTKIKLFYSFAFIYLAGFVDLFTHTQPFISLWEHPLPQQCIVIWAPQCTDHNREIRKTHTGKEKEREPKAWVRLVAEHNNWATVCAFHLTWGLLFVCSMWVCVPGCVGVGGCWVGVCCVINKTKCLLLFVWLAGLTSLSANIDITHEMSCVLMSRLPPPPTNGEWWYVCVCVSLWGLLGVLTKHGPKKCKSFNHRFFWNSWLLFSLFLSLALSLLHIMMYNYSLSSP